MKIPCWNPSYRLLNTLSDAIDRKETFKKFRSSCSNFIKKDSVRIFILNKFNNKCVNCDSKERLEIDHIQSVYSCFINMNYYYCNKEENLQVLCKKCNTSKIP